MLCHDPRISNDRSHKIETDNAALMSAELILQAAFNGAITDEVDWEAVAYAADHCDLPPEPGEVYEIPTFPIGCWSDARRKP